MTWIVRNLWLIPVLPLLAAGLSALLKRPQRGASATFAIGAMAASFLLSCAAFAETLGHSHGTSVVFRETHNFDWFALGESTVRLGWVLDPLTAVMLVMVTFVGLLIFIYSVGYMAHDGNFTRFFTFLSLFAAAMLGLVIANSLLLFFISWELVGLASYLLIGFWYHKPSAAAAAKKAFITTRIGDIGFFLGLLWLYSQTGTLLFYDGGAGCLEGVALSAMGTKTLTVGLGVSTAIGLLIFCGAMGKSGQVPLHVWLPDAMEGPTPVSALIHAATMVAAGVFLVARVYPLMSGNWGQLLSSANPADHSVALLVITYVGAITAVFASLIAVAQTDIKRILAYSTVAQLGFMFMGLGVGGVAVGMFHLITHAFFKALLFLGAGSVIHGCHEEQDIRRMGGVKKYMPVTFATYAVGMMALSGVPFFAGFFSKDEILHAAHGWQSSHLPFYLGLFGALLTAFYMTRQMCYVFFGEYRSRRGNEAEHASPVHHPPPHVGGYTPHESPAVMTIPLVILAGFAFGLGFLGTPAWPWFQDFLGGTHVGTDLKAAIPLMLLSTVVVATGIGLAWWLYGRKSITSADAPDPLEQMQPGLFVTLREKFYVDEFYTATVVRFNAAWARACDLLDRLVLDTAVTALSYLVLGISWVSRFCDEFVINLGFDQVCRRVSGGGGWMARLQDGQVQTYLRVLGVALMALVLFLTWGCGQ